MVLYTKVYKWRNRTPICSGGVSNGLAIFHHLLKCVIEFLSRVMLQHLPPGIRHFLYVQIEPAGNRHIRKSIATNDIWCVSCVMYGLSSIMDLCPIIWDTVSMGTPFDTITVSKERRKLWNPLNAILDTPAFRNTCQSYCQIPLTVFDTEPLLLRKPQEYRI